MPKKKDQSDTIEITFNQLCSNCNEWTTVTCASCNKSMCENCINDHYDIQHPDESDTW